MIGWIGGSMAIEWISRFLGGLVDGRMVIEWISR